MNRVSLLALPLCLGAVFHAARASAAQAPTSQAAPVQAGPPPDRRPPERVVLKALDLDGDGLLSAAEIQKASSSLLTLDRNADGILSMNELLPEPPSRQQSDDMVQRLMAMDANGDGSLSRDEMPGRMATMFDRGDANHDGKLTPDEIRTMLQSQTGPQGRPMGRGRAEGMLRQDPILNALDVDHDGTLSAAEIASAPGALKMLDGNADGILQAAEIRIRPMTPAERATHVMGEWDTNQDGKLARAEAPDRLQQQFSSIDKNGDEIVTIEELTAFFESQPQAPAGPRPGDARAPAASGTMGTPQR